MAYGHLGLQRSQNSRAQSGWDLVEAPHPKREDYDNDSVEQFYATKVSGRDADLGVLMEQKSLRSVLTLLASRNSKHPLPNASRPASNATELGEMNSSRAI